MTEYSSIYFDTAPYIANKVSMNSGLPVQKEKQKRIAGGLTGKFFMSDDFDQTPNCFKEYALEII